MKLAFRRFTSLTLLNRACWEVVVNISEDGDLTEERARNTAAWTAVSHSATASVARLTEAAETRGHQTSSSARALVS